MFHKSLINYPWYIRGIFLTIPGFSWDYPGIIPWLCLDYLPYFLASSLDFPKILTELSKEDYYNIIQLSSYDYPRIILKLSLEYPIMIPRLS